VRRWSHVQLMMVLRDVAVCVRVCCAVQGDAVDAQARSGVLPGLLVPGFAETSIAC
jgi:hypothetical protein